MSKKRISKTKYLAVFATTTLIFLVGMIIGQNIADIKLGALEEIEKDLRQDTMAMEIQYQLLSENPCKALNASSIPFAEELYTLGSKLDHMEKTQGVKDPTVIRLKGQHSLLEIRHWLLLKRAKEECDADLNLILYFYSNEGDCNECEEQGYVLTFLREKYNNTRIYTFDINIENPAIETVKSMYLENYTVPTIIVDDYTYYGFKDKEAIEKILKTKRY